jgi:dihydroneopterin aldolase/D-erythro-7,8-dihydroneopterin triphosphate epimerase
MFEKPLDRINIRDLQARCILGIYPEERREKQEIVINLTLHADLTKACGSDSIDDTVDYKAIKKNVLALVEKSSCFLIERLAEQVAGCCLANTMVKRVDVSIDKPGALRFARSVALEITRFRREAEQGAP